MKNGCYRQGWSLHTGFTVLYSISLVTMMVTYSVVNHDTGSKVGNMLNIFMVLTNHRSLGTTSDRITVVAMDRFDC